MLRHESGIFDHLESWIEAHPSQLNSRNMYADKLYYHDVNISYNVLELYLFVCCISGGATQQFSSKAAISKSTSRTQRLSWWFWWCKLLEYLVSCHFSMKSSCANIDKAKKCIAQVSTLYNIFCIHTLVSL